MLPLARQASQEPVVLPSPQEPVVLPLAQQASQEPVVLPSPKEPVVQASQEPVAPLVLNLQCLLWAQARDLGCSPCPAPFSLPPSPERRCVVLLATRRASSYAFRLHL